MNGENIFLIYDGMNLQMSIPPLLIEDRLKLNILSVDQVVDIPGSECPL